MAGGGGGRGRQTANWSYRQLWIKFDAFYSYEPQIYSKAELRIIEKYFNRLKNNMMSVGFINDLFQQNFGIKFTKTGKENKPK